MSKQRNPDAVCGSCPYWARITSARVRGNTRKPPWGGVCKRVAPVRMNLESWPRLTEDNWCGEHPDFFSEAQTNDTEGAIETDAEKTN